MKRKISLKIAAMVVAVVFCFTTLTGCTQNIQTLTQELNGVADAAQVVVVVTKALQATGKISADVATQVGVYAQSTSVAVSTCVTELNSSDPNPLKISNCSAAFATAASYAAGINQPLVAAAIAGVTVVVNVFLRDLGSSNLLTVSRLAPTAKVPLTYSDRQALKGIQKKAAALMVSSNNQ